MNNATPKIMLIITEANEIFEDVKMMIPKHLLDNWKFKRVPYYTMHGRYSDDKGPNMVKDIEKHDAVLYVHTRNDVHNCYPARFYSSSPLFFILTDRYETGNRRYVNAYKTTFGENAALFYYERQERKQTIEKICELLIKRYDRLMIDDCLPIFEENNQNGFMNKESFAKLVAF